MSTSALFSTFARADLAFERGEGAWLYTAGGEAYLDMMAGVAVNALGHAHPKLAKVLAEQAARLWHVSNLYKVPEQEVLAKRLVDLSFADRVFFCNSGAEAMECAIKTARRWQFVKGHPERVRLITFEGAFHGRTLATLAAGGQEKYLEGFGPKAGGFDQVPFGDIAAVKAAIGPETAGIIAEPVQGEGGVRAFDPAFLKALRELCDTHRLMLVFDEVQTGIGRTGRFFAHEWSGVTPDILAVAKGLGGGFPIGACLATEDAASGMTAGTHGSTFGGNLLAVTVADAVVEEVSKPEFLADVRRKSLLMKQKLAGLVDSHPDVFEGVRGEGLLLGIKCRVPAGDVIGAMRDAHLLCVSAGDNVVRFVPPLNITDTDIDEAVTRADAAARAIETARKA